MTKSWEEASPHQSRLNGHTLKILSKSVSLVVSDLVLTLLAVGLGMMLHPNGILV